MRPFALGLSFVLIFTSSWENLVFIDGIGRISRAIGIALALAWIVTVALSGRVRRWQPFHYGFGLFVLWSACSILWTSDLDSTKERIQTFGQLLVLVTILWELHRTERDIEMAMQAYVLGCLISLGSVFANYLSSVEVMHARFAASGFNPNDFGLIIALGLPMAWHLAVARRHFKSRFITLMNFCYVPAATCGILLAASRGSLIAAVPFIFFLLTTAAQKSVGQRVVILTLAGLFLVAAPFLVPRKSIDRLRTIGDSIASADMNGRVAIWREGLVLLSQNQWLGVGSGAFRFAAQNARTVAHNVFVSVAVELGLVGLMMFLAVLSMVFRDAVRLPRRQLILWMTVLLVWLLGAAVHTWEQRKQTWLVMSFVVASAAIGSGEPAARRGSSGHSRVEVTS